MPLAEHYAHTGMVGLDGEKMSKSKGNLVLVSELTAQGHDPQAIRALLLSHHWRADWSFDPDDLAFAEARLGRWKSAVAHTEDYDADPSQPSPLQYALMSALSGDLNAPAALDILDLWAAGQFPGNVQAADDRPRRRAAGHQPRGVSPRVRAPESDFRIPAVGVA